MAITRWTADGTRTLVVGLAVLLAWLPLTAAQASDPPPQIGSLIEGAPGAGIGSEMALSGDGRVLASSSHPGGDPSGSGPNSSVHVWAWDGHGWSVQGSPIESISAQSAAVDLSHDGLTVAIGETLASSTAGQIRVLRWTGTGWQQQGDPISGVSPGDQLGISVSISADGQRVAAAANMADPGGVEDAGQAQVHEWNGAAWEQLGSSIDGVRAHEGLVAISLSADGDRLAVGASGNDQQFINGGAVRVYELVNNTWEQLGSELVADEAWQSLGVRLELSADGRSFAATSLVSSSPRVAMHRWNGSDWAQVGERLTTEAFTRPQISGDGSRVLTIASGKALLSEWTGSRWAPVSPSVGSGTTYGNHMALSGSGAVVAVSDRRHGPRSFSAPYRYEDFRGAISVHGTLGDVPSAAREHVVVEVGTSTVVDVAENDVTGLATTSWDPARFTVTRVPAMGVAIPDAGKIRYTAGDTPGTDQLTYQVCDTLARCATGVLNVTIAAKSAAPASPTGLPASAAGPPPPPVAVAAEAQANLPATGRSGPGFAIGALLATGIGLAALRRRSGLTEL